jgi:hypothetical protein
MQISTNTPGIDIGRRFFFKIIPITFLSYAYYPLVLPNPYGSHLSEEKELNMTKQNAGVAPEFEPKTSVVTTSTYKPPELNMFPAASETAILLY